MATSNYRENKSQDYREPTCTDVSSLAPAGTAIIGGASMSAGNTVSTQPPIHGGPGSQPANPMPPGAMPDNEVALDAGPQASYTRRP